MVAESTPEKAGLATGRRAPPAIQVENLNAWYGSHHVLRGVSLSFDRNRISAVIGPSGCGKSTLIRCLNRMNDEVPNFRMTGSIRALGEDLMHPDADVVAIRRRIGMLFQKPNPFPKSVFDNVAFGPRLQGLRGAALEARVEESLRAAALWEEVRDRLKKNAMELSGGQQQRLCLARALAVAPEVLLLDEPCSALDPIATQRIEELFVELKERYTIVLVTHNMQQAARISDRCALLWMGELVEEGRTQDLFTRPKDPRTDDYLRGRVG